MEAALDIAARNMLARVASTVSTRDTKGTKGTQEVRMDTRPAMAVTAKLELPTAAMLDTAAQQSTARQAPTHTAAFSPT